MKNVYFFVIITALCFGTMEVALKLAGSRMDPFQLTFLRFMVGGLLLLPFALAETKKAKTTLRPKDFFYLLSLGILAIPVSMMFFQLGVINANASTASVLMSVNPLFTMIFAHYLAAEPMNKTKGAVLLLGLAGIFFMIKPWALQPGNTLHGVLFMLLAALTFGLYTVAGKRSLKKLGILAQTSISFILGSLVLLGIMLFCDKPVLAGVAQNWLLVLYISVFVTGVGYLSYFTAIKRSDAATGSVAFFLKTIIAPVLAVLFLGESLLWNTYVGGALLLLASYLNIREKKKEQSDETHHLA